MPMRPTAPAIPAPTIPVGREAPPEEEELLLEVAAAVVAAAVVVSLVIPEPVAEAVELLNLPVAEEALEPVPVTAALVGTAAPAAVMK